MWNTRVLSAGLAVLLAASSIEASAFLKPSGQFVVESGVELTAGKKKGKKAAKKSKATKVAAFKSCGTYMYHKDGKCVDARAKK
jgi:hypothetical protein